MAKTSNSITLQVDVDNDDLQDDNLYATYNHLIDVTPLAVGTKVAYSDLIAYIDTAYAHLHFGNRSNVQNDGDYEWIRNEVYYRDNLVTQWNQGKDLDLESVVGFSSNTVSLTIYVMDNTVKKYINQGDVRIYHRRSGQSTWSWDNMVRLSDQQTFQFNLRNRYAAGVTVDWMVRIERSDQKQSYPNDYYFAFHPEKYETPNQDPNAVSNPYSYYTTPPLT